MSDRIIIGTRGSKLALWQTNWVKGELERRHPGLQVETEVISTKGDRVLDVSLPKLGEQGKGLFTQELEDALRERRVDLAVHSLKDLPTELPEGLHIGAICEREDVRDALVARSGIASFADLPGDALVGTSSLRRQAQVRAVRPDMRLEPIRGNVDTRLRKLSEGQFDAIILASAGLHRLGFAGQIPAHLSGDLLLPAVGQGALAIETRSDDRRVSHWISALNHTSTQLACRAERAFLKGLGGGCLVPIAAHAEIASGRLNLSGLVASTDGVNIVRGRVAGAAPDAEELGKQLAGELIGQGADRILSRG